MTATAWLTILAIVLGPILAVLTQLGMQRRKERHDQKLWVFSTLMGVRASFFSNQTAVQAFNLIDVVFYDKPDIREKRKEFMDIIQGATGRDLKDTEQEKLRDLMSEMLAKMGSELGFRFDHTEIKDLAYNPQGLQTMPEAVLAVLKGQQSLSVSVRNEDAQARPPLPGPGILGRR